MGDMARCSAQLGRLSRCRLCRAPAFAGAAPTFAPFSSMSVDQRLCDLPLHFRPLLLPQARASRVDVAVCFSISASFGIASALSCVNDAPLVFAFFVGLALPERVALSFSSPSLPLIRRAVLSFWKTNASDTSSCSAIFEG